MSIEAALSLEEWLQWLENYQDTVIELGLDRILQVAKNLNLNVVNCPVITVAGTNGKGSTVAVLEAIAVAANLQVGSYTSPHMFSFLERIKINCAPVSEQTCIAAFKAVKASMAIDDRLTYFEFATLVALEIFKNNCLDLVILEVGLGGRLDAVNIIENQVSIITSISLEHCQYLGNTIEAIAYEKAGIIKENSMVVSSVKDVTKVIDAVAKLKNAKINNIDKDFFVEENGEQWTYKSKNRTIENLPMLPFPLQNVACAITAIDLVSSLKITEQQIIKALSNLKMLGRFQVYKGKCEIIFDVAHNPGAAKWLSEKLKLRPVIGKTTVIIGISSDKDVRAIIKPFIDWVDSWYTIGLENSRLLSAEVLAQNIQTMTVKPFNSCQTMLDAIRCALDKTETTDRLLIFGSFITVSLALKIIYAENYS